MTTAPHSEVYTYDNLVNRICDGEDWRRFPDLFDADGDYLPELDGKFFLVSWGDNVQTTTHLVDATIHGPYDTSEEAA